VDPVPDPLILTKSGSAGNRTRTTGPAARNLPLDYWLNKFNPGLPVMILMTIIITS
jgi:hypothetical protein